MTLINQRTLVDGQILVTQALGNGAGTTVIGNIDLSPQPYAATEEFDLVLTVPALPNNLSGQNIVFQPQHCATSGGSYVNMPYLAAQTLTGVVTTGSAATTYRWKITPDALEFIQILATQTGAGNNSASSVTLALNF